MKLFKVTVQKVGRQWFIMCNGYKAGMRLFKGDSKNNKDGRWPFPYKGYGAEFPKKSIAEEAAEKLQKYLDVRDAELVGAKK